MSAEQIGDGGDQTQNQAQGQAQGKWPRVAVLMPVFKPQPTFLLAQLSSLRAQRQADVQVYCIVADQVSGEEISRLAGEAGLAVSLIQPDRALKVTAAIALGLEKALEEGDFDYLAFCDQDDVWLADKVHQQVQILTDRGAGLTYSDALVVDAQDRQELGRLHALERRPRVPSMINLALGNIGTGMTFLMTHDFAVTLQAFLDAEDDEMLHDYQAMILGAQLGQVVFDNRAWVRYRQHVSNLVGLSHVATLWRRAKAVQAVGPENDDHRRLPLPLFLDAPGLLRVSCWYYGRQRRRFMAIRRLEAEIWTRGLKPIGTSLSQRPLPVFGSVFVNLFGRRWVRAFNAIVLLWLMARYPAPRARWKQDGG